ncbi:MAG TPA: hypothetical protein VMU64_09115 [Acidimicrobiales bacterium]|nr:hypothetical protein [Acidimicrobiales bacterium]
MATPWQYAQIEEQRREVFARVRRASRWIAATAVAATVVIVGVVSHQIPGRSSVANATPAPSVSTPAPSAGPVSSGQGPANTGSGVVAPPVPAPTQRTPTAVSGGTGW